MERLGVCATHYMERRAKRLERGVQVVGGLPEATPGPLQGACQAAELKGGTLRLKVRPGAERWLAEIEKREMAAKLGVKNIKLCV